MKDGRFGGLIPKEGVSMSTETQNGGDDLEDRVTNFLRRNFPQIRCGGSAAIQDIDRERRSPASPSVALAVAAGISR